jgi:hypothetical protein
VNAELDFIDGAEALTYPCEGQRVARSTMPDSNLKVSSAMLDAGFVAAHARPLSCPRIDLQRARRRRAVSTFIMKRLQKDQDR